MSADTKDRSSPRQASVRRRLARALAAAAYAVLGLIAAPPPAHAQVPPSPPPQPAVGELGGEGPCAVPASLGTAGAQVSVDVNLRHLTQRVWTIRPSGSGSPRTGGTCNDSARPVVLVVHGFPANELILWPTVPGLYANTIRNLVSNGNIVVFANYNWTTVIDFVNWSKLVQDVDEVENVVFHGFEQAVVAHGNRMDESDVGVWGHSLGGGVASQLVSRISDRGWGHDAMWLGLDAASDLFHRCPGITNPFAPPSPATYDYEQCGDIPLPGHTKVLVTSYQGDSGVIHLASLRLFDDIVGPPDDTKTGVVVNNDCSHTPAGGSCTNTGCYASPYPCQPPQVDCPTQAEDCRAGHLTPTTVAEPQYDARVENHLQYYGIYQHVQAIGDCARFGLNCAIDRTFMGNWSDGPATPSTPYP